MFGLLIGAVFGGIGGYVLGKSSAPSSSSSSSTVSAKVSQWSGRFGPYVFSVARNGSTWSWTIVGQNASGAEPTAVAAITQAIRYVQEQLTPGATDGIKLERGDMRVDATVAHAGENVWQWGIISTDNFANLPEGPIGDAKTRGAAALALMAALGDYVTQLTPAGGGPTVTP